MTASRRVFATLLLVVVALLALGAAGCGSDDESPTVTVPTISVPDDSAATAPATTTTPTETTPTAPDTGDTGGTGSFDPNADDSETNDKPPEPGSAAEKFEQACKENPAACG